MNNFGYENMEDIDLDSVEVRKQPVPKGRKHALQNDNEEELKPELGSDFDIEKEIPFSVLEENSYGWIIPQLCFSSEKDTKDCLICGIEFADLKERHICFDCMRKYFPQIRQAMMQNSKLKVAKIEINLNKFE